MFNNTRSFLDPSGRSLQSGHDSRRKPPGLDPAVHYDHTDFAPPTLASKSGAASAYPAIDWSASLGSNHQGFSSNPPSASPCAHGSIGSISSIGGSVGGSVGFSPNQSKPLSQFQYQRAAQASAMPAPVLMTGQPGHFSLRSQSGPSASLTQPMHSAQHTQTMQFTQQPIQSIQPNQSGQLSSQPEFGGMDETFMADDEQSDPSAAQIISSLKGQIDVLITAIMMSETPSSGVSKGVDAVEVAHRVMTRLESLRAENDRLADLVCGKHSSQLEVANARLLCENEELKAELAQMRVVGPLSH